MFDDCERYDGIAIDVAGPGFRFMDEFDGEICDDAMRARFAPCGRIVMDVVLSNNIEPTSDLIASRLAGGELRT